MVEQNRESGRADVIDAVDEARDAETEALGVTYRPARCSYATLLASTGRTASGRCCRREPAVRLDASGGTIGG